MPVEHIDLKPCPFCGGKAEFRKTTYYIKYEERKEGQIYGYVRCKHCGVSTTWHRAGKYITRKTAIQLWNTRTNQ